MAFIKKIWKDRISQFPNRRTINDGYVTKQVTVGRDEGTITEQGDAFDATNMNDLEQRIEDCYGDVQALVGSEVAAQYDSANVIFDPVATVGHGTGFVVSSEYIANLEVSDLADTEISGQAQGEALVWDGTKWVNGTVSTVGNLDDLSDVDTDGKATGDSLRYDGAEWVAKPTTVEMTQAEWNAIADKAAWRNAHKNTHLVIKDAPNLNATASDIEYSSGVTVKQAIDGKVGVNDTPIQLVKKYLNSACQWFTTNLGQNTNTMVISTTDNLATNNAIHILLFGRYGAWAIRVGVDGTGNFSGVEVTKLESGSNTVTASVSGKNITLTGLGTWSTFLGVIVKDYYPNVAFTISQS